MYFDMIKHIGTTLALLSTLSPNVTFASQASDTPYSLQSPTHFLSSFPSYFNAMKGHAVVQLGGYWSEQGKSQFINIEDLVGDDFTVTNHQASNGLVGFGYYIDGQEKNMFKMSYGVNFFYLPKTAVSGTVIQEDLFTNLSYDYNVTHYPVYAIAKSTIDTKSTDYGLTIDVGIGPNFMQTSYVHEYPIQIDTLSDNIFSGRTTTTFSATAGIGIKFNHVIGSAPLECGYRFFYLGQGNFNKETNQIIDTLNTGTAYANAVMCGITI